MRRFNYLAIPLVVLLTACQTVSDINPLSSDDAPSADGVSAGSIPSDFDMDAAAEKLGVNVDDLKSALGDQPLDMATAAEKLGVSESALRDAVPF